MTISAGRISAIAVASVLFFQTAYAEDSERLLELRANPPISAEAIQQEQSLSARYEELQGALKQKDLSKEDKKALKAELKTVKSELKSIQKANKKASKDYDKEVKKLEKNLKKTYGMGPYPADTRLYVESRPEPLQPYYRSLFIEGERNAVLNFNRLGLAAMELGYLDHAEWAFDRSIDKIEAIFADNDQAKAAKSKFQAESVKEYKGEPYERAMAYYYRGLLYLARDDYENARAMFRSGEYQDTVSEAEDFQADFALLNYLDGWALQCQGRSGDESYAKAAEFREGLTAPAPDHNMLFVTELGAAPVKYGDGQYKEILKFRPDQQVAETAAQPIVVNADTGMVHASPAAYVVEDIYFQASTRGGRPVDGILEGKAQFKETTAAVGNAMNTAGTVTALAGLYGGNSDTALVGAGIALIGGLFGAASEAAKPEADTRQWDNLPHFVSVATHKAPGNGYVYGAEFSGTGAQVPEMQSAAMVAGGDACTVVWTRSRSATAVGESSPGARLDWNQMRKQPEAVQRMDVAFRTWLNAETPGEAMGAE